MAEASPRSIGKRFFSWSPTLLMLFGAALYFGNQWYESRGFNPDWPDAIVCDVKEPEPLTATQWVPTTFIFRGIAPRGRYGTVAMYFFPGWQNGGLPKVEGMDMPSTGYVTHEIWFSTVDKSLQWPTKSAQRENLFEAFYRISFPHGPDGVGSRNGVNCGGTNMTTIEAAKGRAFTFARPYK